MAFSLVVNHPNERIFVWSGLVQVLLCELTHGRCQGLEEVDLPYLMLSCGVLEWWWVEDHLHHVDGEQLIGVEDGVQDSRPCGLEYHRGMPW